MYANIEKLYITTKIDKQIIKYVYYNKKLPNISKATPYNFIHLCELGSHLGVIRAIAVSTVVHPQEMAHHHLPVRPSHFLLKVTLHPTVHCVQVHHVE